MRLDDGSVSIARLGLRAHGLDPVVGRLRLEAVLDGSELHPRALPPSAILVVRALRDPGGLRLDGPSPRWQAAAREAVRQQLMRAARPARGDADGADAVLFADRAELLACLLRDWHAGATRWWWRLLGYERQPLATAVAELAREVEWLPPTFAVLAEHGVLAPVLRALAPEAVRGLLAAVARKFALVELDVVIEALEAPRVVAVMASAPPAELPRAPDQPALLAAAAVAEPLPATAQVLHAVALMLQRAPQMARSRRFATQLAARVAEAQRVAPASATGVAAGVAVHGDAPAAARAPGLSAARTFSAGPEEARPSPAPAPPALSSHAEPARSGHPAGPGARATAHVPAASPREELPSAPASAPDSPAHAAPQPLPTSVIAAVEHALPTPAIALVPTPALVAPPPLAPAATDVEPDDLAWPRVVETELGGLFFLVNLALFLELYGDFTQPRHADLSMPLFDFVELLGRALGADGDDPLWALFAELSGREQPAAHDFVPPVAWAVSDAWLAPFADAPGAPPTRPLADPSEPHLADLSEPHLATPPGWSITTPPGRWCLHHPAGFIAADLPWLPAAALPRAPALARWLAWIAGYCRARLIRATGLADLAPLWRRRARVFVTGARIDVELALADHPLEVRIAGLDRDPGWIPGAGRDLRFHFR